MAKRFTDTEKWRDEWWGSLPNDYRIIWLYLIDSCSIAGIWKKDFRGMNFNCNTKIEEEAFIKVFGSRLIDRGQFFFIPKFLRFQCPKGLNSNKPAVLSIVKELQLNNLTEIVNESFGNDFLIIKDKDKGKGKGTDNGKGNGQGQAKISSPEPTQDPEAPHILVDDEKVFDVVKLLELREAALNGRCSEHKLPPWRTLIPPWFTQNLGGNFKDTNHVFNAFSKHIITNNEQRAKTPRVNGQKPAGERRPFDWNDPG
jgi:hypothetical protein